MEVIIPVILIIIVLYIITTYIMFVLISKKTKKELLPMTKNVTIALKPYKKIIDNGLKWLKNQKPIDVTIESKDHLKLHSVFIENKKNKGILIELHGYRSIPERDLSASCHEYYDMGLSILLPDHRCCNKSEGKYITFGIKESEDLLEWIKYCNNKYPNTNIYLAGISMGATTVLLSLKDIKDNNVKMALVDSPYIYPLEEIKYCLKTYYHLYPNLFTGMINIWCKLIAHFNLNEKNVLDSINNTKIPILWIHGTNDNFVPSSNSITCYNTYKGPKDLLLIENANHGMGYLVDPDKYITKIKEFISKEN